MSEFAELDHDLVPFIQLHETVLAAGMNPSRKVQIASTAQVVARKHSAALATIFGLWLEELVPGLQFRSLAQGTEFSFSDSEDATAAASMAINQTGDAPVSVATAMGLVMAYLHRGGHILTMTDEEANATIRSVARLVYSHRQRVVHQFISEGETLLRADRRRAVLPWVIGLAVLAFVIWAARG